MIYLTLFFEFFKVGLFTIGGGFAMLPLIEETVIKYGWVTESQFYDFVGVCESTPGPIAVNVATYIGSVQGGVFGSIAATLGVVMPSFIIILLIAAVLKNFTENKYFKGFIKGVKPVVVALIISTGVILAVKAIGYASLNSFNLNIKSIIIFALLVLIYFGVKYIFKKKMSSIVLIVISATLGIGVSFLENVL